MTSVTRDENREGEAIGCGHFRRGRGGGGSTVQEANDTTKWGAAAREVEGGG
jgi:hypothetical protein